MAVDRDEEVCYTVDDCTALTVETKEAKGMKKHWQRGILLGVSIALLLSGGVALAAGVYVEVNKVCFECYAGNGLIPEEYIPRLTYGGWSQQSDNVCVGISNPDDDHWFERCESPPIADSCWAAFNVYCDGSTAGDSDCIPAAQAQELGTANANGVESMYGEWVGWVEETVGGNRVGYAKATFLFAEDCAAAMFVPEPGSILLLGSGLAGLAGYATLRLRSGQALRWRTRE